MRLRVTIPHVYGFERSVRLPSGALGTPADWDAVRLASHSGGFGFEVTKAQWVARAVARTDLRSRAQLVSELLMAWGAAHVVSVGAGTGIFEFHLMRAAPALHLRCGDFAVASLDLLRKRLGDAADVEYMDLRTTDWVRESDEPVIMHRVDTELSDVEWQRAFEQLWQRQVERIAWIPCGLLTPARVTSELKMVASAILQGRRVIRAGYLRSDPRMLELFDVFYRRSAVKPGAGLPIWILERR